MATVDEVVDAFDAEQPMSMLLTLLEHLWPDADPEAFQEIAMLLKCVYISGVFAEVKALTGSDAETIGEHLCQTWERIYWMQHQCGEA